MANLKREFQKDDVNKVVPIQLLTAVNASTAVSVDLARDMEQQGNTKKLEIRFPSNSSAMAFLVGSSKVEDVKICPPGIASVNFAASVGQKYSVYVVSKEYEDGFVYVEDSPQYRVRNNMPSGKLQKEFEIEDNDIVVDLTREEALMLAVDPTDRTQWYAYSDYYPRSEVIWETITDSIEIDEIIYTHQHITNMIEILQENDLLNKYQVLNWNEGIYAVKAMADIYSYLKPLNDSTKETWFQEKIDEINSIFKIATTNKLDLNETSFNYLTEDEKNYLDLYNMAEAKLTLSQAVRWGRYQPAVGESRPEWRASTVVSAYRMGSDDFVASENYNLIKYKGVEAFAKIYPISQYDETRAPGDGHPQQFEIALSWGLHGTMFKPQDGTGSGYLFNIDKWLTENDIPHTDILTPEDVDGTTGDQIYTKIAGADFDVALNNHIIGVANIFLREFNDIIQPMLDLVEEQMRIKGDIIFCTGQIITSTTITSTTQTLVGYNITTGDRLSSVMGIDADSSMPPTSSQVPAGGEFGPWKNQEEYSRLVEMANDRVRDINQIATTNEYIKIGDEVMRLIGDASWQVLEGRYDPNEETIQVSYKVERAQAGTEARWHGQGGGAVAFAVTFEEIYSSVTEDVIVSGYTTPTRSAGDSGFTRPDGSQPVAHEATLQNIRFLKNQLTEINNNVWSSVNGANSVMVGAIHRIEQELFSQGINYTQTNLTNPFISIGDVDVYYSMVSSDKSIPVWNKLNAAPTIIEDEGIILLSLNELKDVGKYLVSVRPKKLKLLGINKSDEELDTITLVDVDSIGEDGKALYGNSTKSNAYKSWNLQITDQNGKPKGPQRIIVASENYSSGYVLQVHPSHNLPSDIDYCTIWSNKFEPIMIDLDIVEHNNLTLSYSMYGKREFNKDTGLVKLYDYNGNEYKTLSYGTEDTPTSGGLVEYRRPTES
jgi:uncharacterized ubiquitin-like protein YukD